MMWKLLTELLQTEALQHKSNITELREDLYAPFLILLGGFILARLTKELLQGAKAKKDITVKFQGEDMTLTVRPLTGPESGEVEAKAQEGNEMKGKPGRNGKMEQSMSIDISKNTVARRESDMIACAYGMIDPEMTLKEVKDTLTNDLIQQIAGEIKDLSGISNKQEVERFRSEQSGDQGGNAEPLHLDEGGGDTAERVSGDESPATGELNPSSE